jgi:nitrite reductase (cytochrome c-552)
VETPYGGSVVYSKLERYPAMTRIWAGYAFAIDHNEERGHYYAQIDQANTERVKAVEPAGGVRELPRRGSAGPDRADGLGGV